MIIDKGKVMKVGNSNCLLLSKFICNNYNLKKGDTMKIVMTESGLFLFKKNKDSNSKAPVNN